MATRASTPANFPKSSAELRAAVKVPLFSGQRAADHAKVRTYHETGRHIRHHILANQDRADYGAKTILRLAADLQLARSGWQRCDPFYCAFPIWATWPKLTWAHFRTLSPMADTKLRRALATEANHHEWAVVQLEHRVRALAPPEATEVVAMAPPTKHPLLIAWAQL